MRLLDRIVILGIKKTVAWQEELTIDGLPCSRSFIKNGSPWHRDEKATLKLHIQLLDPMEPDQKNFDPSIVGYDAAVSVPSSHPDFDT